MEYTFSKQVEAIRMVMDLAQQLKNDDLYKRLNCAAGTIAAVGFQAPKTWYDLMQDLRIKHYNNIELMIAELTEQYEVPLPKVYHGKREKAN